MSKADDAFSRSQQMFDTTIGWRFVNPLMKQIYGTDSMPETAENIAIDYAVSRQDQDAFALRSQQRYAEAEQAGIFAMKSHQFKMSEHLDATTFLRQDEHPSQR